MRLKEDHIAEIGYVVHVHVWFKAILRPLRVLRRKLSLSADGIHG